MTPTNPQDGAERAVALVRRIAARESWQSHYGKRWEDEAAEIVAAIDAAQPIADAGSTSGEDRCETCGETNAAFFCSNGFHVPSHSGPAGNAGSPSGSMHHNQIATDIAPPEPTSDAVERLREAMERQTRALTHDGSEHGTAYWWVRVRYDDLAATLRTAPSERARDITDDEVGGWLQEHCGRGLPYDNAHDLASALHGTAYTLRQIEGTNKYTVNIGQSGPASTSLRWLLAYVARNEILTARQAPDA